MKKRVVSCLVPLGCTILAVSLIAAYIGWTLSGKTEVTTVIITQNLNGDGWYWTQFNLPTGGKLMELSNKEGYEEYKALKDSMAMRANIHSRVFYGTFCCAQTIPGKYVFLPTQKLNAGVEALVFFAADGSVWVIPNSPALLTPKNGEIEVQAIIYR